ncbi:response regulator [Rhizobium sp. NXC24]|uniref:response regulator n=1 Tax=Rhizobium sp. NXC24 TaxID=2048897 RepID=UPI000CDF30A2|nr:response regulator [Rhizobium sp. NXC24]AVA25594.1 response regulator CheY-like domain-containing protein [Rhizobium sp. NXC24]
MSKEPAEQPVVLVVEDEYLLAFDLAVALGDQELTVLGPAPTIDQAFSLIAATDEIDCAILDVSIKGQMVFPVAEVLSKRGIPFVFTTGYENSIFGDRFTDIEVYSKPLDVERLAVDISSLAHDHRVKRVHA